MKAADAKSVIRVHLARAVATAIVGGIDELRQGNMALTQLQEMRLVEMALMAHADAIREAEEQIDIEEQLSDLINAGRDEGGGK